MDCEKSEEFGPSMEPPPSESSLPDGNAVHAAAGISEQSQETGAEPENTEWRNELAARLNRYRARRKAPPPRYPSLKLPFVPAESPRTELSNSPVYESVSNHALALDATVSEPPRPAEPAFGDAPPPSESSRTQMQPLSQTGQPGAKIIEFPRFAWGPPPPPPDQLAEPVIERPRILEVPETAPPPPALGGITIEPVQLPEPEKRPGIDIPLQNAPFGLRIFAALVDGSIIAAASALFGYIFWRLSAIHPPRLQMIIMGAVIPSLFWAAYHYMLIVYSGSTPGLLAASLELTRFDGGPTKRSLRRWRILASYLSAASLGMGYAWVFLDEDGLCWHDRITRTYLAPRNLNSKS